MSDYLPADLWSQILQKLPVKSIIRCTTVCKSWKSIITSRNFIYSHLSRPQNQSILRRYDKHDKLEHYSLIEFTGKNDSFAVKSSPELEFPLKSQIGYYRVVGSCYGIVCLIDDFFSTSPPSIYLWNPSVKNLVALPPAINNPKQNHIVILGVGVVNNVYKVVRLVYCRKPQPEDYGFLVPPQAEVYSLRDGVAEGWRSVAAFDVKLRILEFMWCQVLLEGIVHWLGYEPVTNTSCRSSILTFDLDDEVFGEVMLADVLARQAVSNMCLYKIGGSLAVVITSDRMDIEAIDIWVMKEYGVKESWAKMYQIHLAEGFERVVAFENGEAILAYMGLDLISHNLETGKGKRLGIYGTPRSFFIDDYLESLLLLKGISVPAAEEVGLPLEGLSLAEC